MSAAGALALLTSCSSGTQASPGVAPAPDQTELSAVEEGGISSPGDLPSRHVHAVAVDPGDGQVYLATHDGLFRYGETGPQRVGPVIDLVGFSVVGPGHFYASGHPGPGTDLPNPVGLIESTDAGRTWTPRSLQGQSDFHALAASAAGVVGHDGTLRTTDEGSTWRDLEAPVKPYALAASPDGRVLLGTSEAGLVRSPDAGVTWAPVGGAPLLLVVDWAGGDTVAGVTPAGVVAVSRDAGLTWQETGSVGAAPQAVGASFGAGEQMQVLVVTHDAALSSSDGGATLRPLVPGVA